jgi:hypothetical protein
MLPLFSVFSSWKKRKTRVLETVSFSTLAFKTFIIHCHCFVKKISLEPVKFSNSYSKQHQYSSFLINDSKNCFTTRLTRLLP